MHVMVINQCAHNKGDRAVLWFLLRELAPKVSRVTVATSNPAYWQGENRIQGMNVAYVPWGWQHGSRIGRGRVQRWLTRARRIAFRRAVSPTVRYLINSHHRTGLESIFCNRRFFRALKEADLVLSTGGHHITTWLAGDAISLQMFDMAIALLAKKPLTLWSQTIGPMQFADPRNDHFVRNILAQTSTIYVRDTQSVVELDELEIEPEKVRKTPESVIGLYDPKTPIPSHKDRKPIVGISVYGSRRRLPDEHHHYIHTLARFIDHMAERGYAVHFFPMGLKNSPGDDRLLIQEILTQAHHYSHCLVQDEDLDPLSHIAQIRQCQLFVGHKTHSIIFALVAPTPLVAIAYHSKTSDFMAQYGLSSYCIQDHELDADRLVSTSQMALSNADAIVSTAASKSKEFSAKVREDLDQLLFNAGQLQEGKDTERQ